MKRIIFPEEAKADIRASRSTSPEHPHCIHRLAESGAGRVKTLQDKRGEKRLRVGDYRVRFTEEHPETLRIHTVKNRKDAYR